MKNAKLNPITIDLRATMRAMSDHQILGFVDVMMLDDHCPRDQTATYVAAYEEAERRNLLDDD